MDLVLSVASFSALIVTYSLVLVGARNPRSPWWASEGMVANVWCLLMVGLLAYGICFATRFALTWEKQALGVRELLLSTGIAVAAIVAVSVISPRRRLAAYAARETDAASVIPIGAASAGASSPEIQPDPRRGPDLPKAA